MKKQHVISLVISFILLVAGCSALSMTSVASNYRFTAAAMNPWNGVEGVAFTMGYFLHTEGGTSMVLAIALLLIVWWRLYALVRNFTARFSRNDEGEGDNAGIPRRRR